MCGGTEATRTPVDTRDSRTSDGTAETRTEDDSDVRSRGGTAHVRIVEPLHSRGWVVMAPSSIATSSMGRSAIKGTRSVSLYRAAGVVRLRGMKKTALAVAVAAMLSACGGPDELEPCAMHGDELRCGGDSLGHCQAEPFPDDGRQLYYIAEGLYCR
jgi:hypothetical protein